MPVPKLSSGVVSTPCGISVAARIWKELKRDFNTLTHICTVIEIKLPNWISIKQFQQPFFLRRTKQFFDPSLQINKTKIPLKLRINKQWVILLLLLLSSSKRKEKKRKVTLSLGWTFELNFVKNQTIPLSNFSHPYRTHTRHAYTLKRGSSRVALWQEVARYIGTERSSRLLVPEGERRGEGRNFHYPKTSSVSSSGFQWQLAKVAWWSWKGNGPVSAWSKIVVVASSVGQGKRGGGRGRVASLFLFLSPWISFVISSLLSSRFLQLVWALKSRNLFWCYRFCSRFYNPGFFLPFFALLSFLSWGEI